MIGETKRRYRCSKLWAYRSLLLLSSMVVLLGACGASDQDPTEAWHRYQRQFRPLHEEGAQLAREAFPDGSRISWVTEFNGEAAVSGKVFVIDYDRLDDISPNQHLYVPPDLYPEHPDQVQTFILIRTLAERAKGAGCLRIGGSGGGTPVSLTPEPKNLSSFVKLVDRRSKKIVGATMLFTGPVCSDQPNAAFDLGKLAAYLDGLKRH